jgi:hypothetical protein
MIDFEISQRFGERAMTEAEFRRFVTRLEAAERMTADFENPQRFGSEGSNSSAPPHPARFSPNGTGQRG